MGGRCTTGDFDHRRARFPDAWTDKKSNQIMRDAAVLANHCARSASRPGGLRTCAVRHRTRRLGRMVVIEMNPPRSRAGSALGVEGDRPFPIAKIAAPSLGDSATRSTEIKETTSRRENRPALAFEADRSTNVVHQDPAASTFEEVPSRPRTACRRRLKSVGRARWMVGSGPHLQGEPCRRPMRSLRDRHRGLRSGGRTAMSDERLRRAHPHSPNAASACLLVGDGLFGAAGRSARCTSLSKIDPLGSCATSRRSSAARGAAITGPGRATAGRGRARRPRRPSRASSLQAVGSLHRLLRSPAIAGTWSGRHEGRPSRAPPRQARRVAGSTRPVDNLRCGVRRLHAVPLPYSTYEDGDFRCEGRPPTGRPARSSSSAAGAETGSGRGSRFDYCLRCTRAFRAQGRRFFETIMVNCKPGGPSSTDYGHLRQAPTSSR